MGHTVQMFGLENDVPAGHVMHVVLELAPMDEEKVPDGHGVQLDDASEEE